MTGIIVTGHGHFPSGLLSAVSLIAGKPENTAAVDFTEGMSTADLKAALEEAIHTTEGDEILILTDLVGGTPFNTAAGLQAEQTQKTLKVLAGTNMPALVEAVFSRAFQPLDALVPAVIAAGKDGLQDLEGLSNTSEAPAFEDGL